MKRSNGHSTEKVGRKNSCPDGKIWLDLSPEEVKPLTHTQNPVQSLEI